MSAVYYISSNCRSDASYIYTSHCLASTLCMCALWEPHIWNSHVRTASLRKYDNYGHVTNYASLFGEISRLPWTNCVCYAQSILRQIDWKIIKHECDYYRSMNITPCQCNICVSVNTNISFYLCHVFFYSPCQDKKS